MLDGLVKTSDNAFFLRTLPTANYEIWYYKKVAGRETLGNVVNTIMKKGGFEGHYTNHSSGVVLLQDCIMPEYLNKLFRRLLLTVHFMGLKHINVLHRRLNERQIKYWKVKRENI